jgi:hypothetical protein
MDLVRDAIHIVPGDSAGASLRPTGMRVRVDPEMLACGPCDFDEARHAKLRRGFWRSEYRLGGWRWTPRVELRWPQAGRVALWSSPWIPDRLFLWHAVHRLADRPVELWHVEARTAESVVQGMGTMPRDGIPESLAHAKRIQRRELVASRRAWQAFTSGDLGYVAKALDPSLRPTMLDFLPRRSRGGLQLSVHDKRLLAGFESWRGPIDALKSNLPELLVFGDLLVLTRLLRWTRTPEPALEARQPSKAISWKGPDLRLTPFGRRLLEKLRSSWEAPSLVMGGHEIYGPRSFATTPAGRIIRL